MLLFFGFLGKVFFFSFPNLYIPNNTARLLQQRVWTCRLKFNCFLVSLILLTQKNIYKFSKLLQTIDTEAKVSACLLNSWWKYTAIGIDSFLFCATQINNYINSYTHDNNNNMFLSRWFIFISMCVKCLPSMCESNLLRHKTVFLYLKRSDNLRIYNQINGIPAVWTSCGTHSSVYLHTLHIGGGWDIKEWNARAISNDLLLRDIMNLLYIAG